MLHIVTYLTSQSAEANSNSKKLPPRFRLVTRRDDRSPMTSMYPTVHIYSIAKTVGGCYIWQKWILKVETDRAQLFDAYLNIYMDLTLLMLKSTTNFFAYTMCYIIHISFTIYGFSCYYNVDCICFYSQVATLNIMCCVITTKPDMVGTIILNPSALSSAMLSIAEDEKIYHLVKYSNCTNICFMLY